MKYQLLLKDALRYTERANLQRERADLLRAVEIMLVVPKAADDMMNVGRLNGFPGKLTAQGKLIKQGLLLFCDITPLLTSLDASELLAQFENKQQQLSKTSSAAGSGSGSGGLAGFMAKLNDNSNSGGGGGGSSNASFASSSSSSLYSHQQQQQQPALTTALIGTSQMSNVAQILLNQLLSNSNQLKLRERQTFLFEQTIIFSEVPGKSGGWRSGSHQTSAGYSSSGWQPGSSTAPENFHPCYAHSHSELTGAAETCCFSGSDCGQPQTGSERCSRLLRGNIFKTAAGERRRNQPDESGAAGLLASEPACRETIASNPLRRDSVLPASACSSSSAAAAAEAANANYQHHHHLAGQISQSSGQMGIPQYYSMPSYEYKNHLSINKVALIDKHYGPNCDPEQLDQLLGPALDPDLESRRFMLKSRDPNQENVIYLLQTGCAFDRDDWVCSIRSMLECQLDFLRALQSPIAYQQGLSKEGLVW